MATFSSIAIVKEVAPETGNAGITNLWIAPRASLGTHGAIAPRASLGTHGASLARLDSTTHNDQGSAFESFWQSGLMRGKSEFVSRMIRVAALDLWIRGNGTLLTTVAGPDGTQSVTPQLCSASGVPATLADAPGMMYQEKFDLAHVENYTVQVGTNAVDEYWELSEITGYTKADLFNR